MGSMAKRKVESTAAAWLEKTTEDQSRSFSMRENKNNRLEERRLHFHIESLK